MKCSIVKLVRKAISLYSQEGESETIGDATGVCTYNPASPEFVVEKIANQRFVHYG